MNTNLQGRAFVFGNNVDTDQIYPGRFVQYTDVEDVAKYAMHGVDPEFIHTVKEGDIIVAGTNFGCGSSREHAAITLKAVGVGAIIAESFGRIFYRNAINIGLPIVECPEASEKIQPGDQISVDFDTGVITNLTKGERYQGEPFPAFIQGIISAGGLMNAIKTGKL